MAEYVKGRADRPDPSELHARFLVLLPAMQKVIRFHVRGVRCLDARVDFACEAVALCWLWYVRLVAKGKDPEGFVTALARFSAVAARSGRRLCGQERTRDVLAKSRRCPTPTDLSDSDPGLGDALCDNTATPVPDQVQFRVDFPAWAGRLPGFKLRVLDRLARGDRAGEVASALGLTAGRVSQLRREFRDGYRAFCGEPSDTPLTRTPRG